MKTLSAEESRVLRELSALRDHQARLAWIVHVGRDEALIHGEIRTPENRIEGCLSNLWVTSSWSGTHWEFECDSDSLIVKGLGRLICRSCCGATAQDIAARRSVPPIVDDPIGSALTQSRRLGLHRLWARIVELSAAAPPPPANP